MEVSSLSLLSWKLITYVFFFIFCLQNSLSEAVISNSSMPPVRAVSLGGWLVTEGWIKPSLFEGIPNGDLLDGTQLQFMSVTTRMYISAEQGGGTILVANRTSASGWETFRLWRINETSFNFRAFGNEFIGVDTKANGVGLVAVAKHPSVTETFQFVRNSHNSTRVRIRAPNGLFLQVKNSGLVTADNKGNGGWGDDDPSVFLFRIASSLHGEYQVTNGYGPHIATHIMREHWSTFVVEEDFNFINRSGLNAVRLPVGWWTAYDPSPPKPYIGGSLKTLDNAFRWAEKYGINIILDLHAAPGSQNGWEHSASRDGSQEWGQTHANIQQTVHVIEFLTSRYASSPSLFAVELINEPLSPGVSLQNLTKYYKLGYDAVRRHSSTAYVVLSNRLGPMRNRELFPLANGFSRSVIDVHYYSLFNDMFYNFTIQQNIDYISNNRSAELSEITTSNGPLIFIGEWVAEWRVNNATKEDYQRYADAQLQVFQHATFGWSYWTLRNVRNHWSFEWMFNNGYLNL